MIDFISFISKINCTTLPCLLLVVSFRCCLVEFPPRYRSCLRTHGNISRLALCLVRIEMKLRRFRKSRFIGFKSGAGCKYLTSISQASIYRLEISVWVTPQTVNCCLLLAAIVGTKIEQHQSGIGCHNNFVKAKDAFSRVRGRFWNMMLMMFYLNVFYLPTLKDVVGQYKLWNEVMFWFKTNDVLQY